MTTEGYKAGEHVFYKDTTDAVVFEVIVKRSATKPGTYLLQTWQGKVKMADQLVQDHMISGRRSSASRMAA